MLIDLHITTANEDCTKYALTTMVRETKDGT